MFVFPHNYAYNDVNNMPKKNNNTNEPLPFKELKEFTKRYPSVWNYCDDMHEHNGKEGLPAWNEICQLQ